jgi:hypothetical protein
MANISDYWARIDELMQWDIHFIELRRTHELEHKTKVQVAIASLYQDPANLPHMKEVLASLRDARDSGQRYNATQLKRVSQAVILHINPAHYAKVKSQLPTQEEITQLKLGVPLATLMDTQPAFTSASRSKYHCPFHNEKTPSFTIYHDSNSYHCFGCSEGGDNIKFLTKLKGFSFLEAINHLRRYV